MSLRIAVSAIAVICGVNISCSPLAAYRTQQSQNSSSSIPQSSGPRASLPDRLAQAIFPASSAYSPQASTGGIDFGGMYGYKPGGFYPNPATGADSCPSGYLSTPVLGSAGTDFPVYLCYRPSTATSKSALDFGGIYGFASGGVVYPNPATFAASCPTGFSVTPVLGAAGFDFPVYLCYRAPSDQPAVLQLGGLFGLATGDAKYPNPVTGSNTCPSGFSVSPVLGQSGVDFPLYFCHRPAASGATCSFGLATIPHGGSIPAFKTHKATSSCEQELRTCYNGALSGSFGYASCYVDTTSGGGSGLDCQLSGVTVPNGSSKKFYLVTEVSAGDSCEEQGLSQIRTCTAGQLTGSAAFARASCSTAAATITNRKMLGEFMPYVWSTPWYPYFNHTVGVDPDRGFALLKEELPRIKAQGLNTLWIGGNAIWKVLQPAPGEWDEVQFDKFKRLLDHLKANNMRAIYQFNYIGPGFAPAGINGCGWYNDPDQVQKFAHFATELAGRLQEYNSMIYYMVYSEQYIHCLVELGLNYYYEGYKIVSATHSESVPADQEPYKTYHVNDVKKVANMLRGSIGRLTKLMPKAIRHQIFVGMHDAGIGEGHLESPIEAPNDFDYFSMAFYPEELEVKNHTNYGYVVDALNLRYNRVRALHPEMPLMLGEFGWTAFDGVKFGPMQHSAKRNEAHEAMLDWALTKKVGFNLWGWLPRFLDDPSLETNPYEDGHQLRMRDGQLTTVLDVVRKKLTGNP